MPSSYSVNAVNRKQKLASTQRGRRQQVTSQIYGIRSSRCCNHASALLYRRWTDSSVFFSVSTRCLSARQLGQTWSNCFLLFLSENTYNFSTQNTPPHISANGTRELEGPFLKSRRFPHKALNRILKLAYTCAFFTITHILYI